MALARGLTVEEQAALNHWSYGTGQVSSVSKSIPVRYAAAKTKLALSYKRREVKTRVLLKNIYRDAGRSYNTPQFSFTAQG